MVERVIQWRIDAAQPGLLVHADLYVGDNPNHVVWVGDIQNISKEWIEDMAKRLGAELRWLDDKTPGGIR